MSIDVRLHALLGAYVRSNATCPAGIQEAVLSRVREQISCSHSQVDCEPFGKGGGEAACRETLSLKFPASLHNYHRHCSTFTSQNAVQRLCGTRRWWWCLIFAATMHTMVCGHVFQTHC